jgi:hypothetical protein
MKTKRKTTAARKMTMAMKVIQSEGPESVRNLSEEATPMKEDIPTAIKLLRSKDPLWLRKYEMENNGSM